MSLMKLGKYEDRDNVVQTINEIIDSLDEAGGGSGGGIEAALYSFSQGGQAVELTSAGEQGEQQLDLFESVVSWKVNTGGVFTYSSPTELVIPEGLYDISFGATVIFDSGGGVGQVAFISLDDGAGDTIVPLLINGEHSDPRMNFKQSSLRVIYQSTGETLTASIISQNAPTEISLVGVYLSITKIG
jgi:hypothetical protein